MSLIIDKGFLSRNYVTGKLIKTLKSIKEIQLRHKFQKLLPSFFEGEVPLFYHVQFETVSICNNDCSFCAMNKHLRTREYKEAEWEVINRLGSELENYSFAGRLSLFNNNEPLIDKRLPDIVSFFRKKVPNAHIRILTNGILINIRYVEDLIKAGIDYIHINNYNNKWELLPSVSKFIQDFNSSKYKDAITISVKMRYKDAILSNRGGSSPNSPPLTKSKKCFCIFPFEQININPWGDMTICCNDLLYKQKMGNIMAGKTLYQLWSSEKYKEIRTLLKAGKREGIGVCSVCDHPGHDGNVGFIAPSYKLEKGASGMYQIRRC